ncbi:hypothetical protein [uncultured Psychrobacter sp.]|uniref:hypothetical protein n=1 Tax=uncultured Psychrobacter sp. TaxID=259303 RepID=UPI00259A4D6A|nr:hypothetical protein [uncultured Psychrobacter sp.]
MTKNNHLPTNNEIAQYLDQDVPLQQQANYEPIPTFIHAQLAYAKSKHSKQAEQKKKAYKKRWFKKEGKQ